MGIEELLGVEKGALKTMGVRLEAASKANEDNTEAVKALRRSNDHLIEAADRLAQAVDRLAERLERSEKKET